MIDIQYIRSNPEVVKNNLKKRNSPELLNWIDEVIKYDEDWRKLKINSDQLRSRRNKVSEEINKAVKENKDISKLKMEASEIPVKIAKIEEVMTSLQTKIKSLLYKIPNLLHDSVPTGRDDSENVEIKTFGKKPAIKHELKSHADLIVEKGWVDLEKAAKISGARWYFLKGNLALLELAISRYAVDFIFASVSAFMMR